MWNKQMMREIGSDISFNFQEKDAKHYYKIFYMQRFPRPHSDWRLSSAYHC